MPVLGHVCRLVTADDGVADVVGIESGGEGVVSVRGSGPGGKNPCTPRWLRLRVMLMMVWMFMVRFVGRISLVMTLLMRLLILDVEGLALVLLMLVVICLGLWSLVPCSS